MGSKAELRAQGDRIRELRCHERMPQDKVAEKVEVTLSAYQRWDAARAN